VKAKNGQPIQWLKTHIGFDGRDCLPWPFSRMESGYAGVVWPDPNAASGVLAHRFMCQLINGPAPSEDHEVAHSCGRGRTVGCVHPKHVRWATPQENADDRRSHGTNTVGERHPKARLTEDAVRYIRRSRESLKTLAGKFGVRESTVCLARSGKTWGHIR
jgi:hypothetical protein